MGDDGLRIVKTMLYHLCKLKGPSIREHLPALPPRVPGEEAAAIVKYVEINLQSFEATHRESSPT